MSLLRKAADLVYTFRFVKMLTTPFNKTKAFELGLIDQDGKRIKTKKITTSEEHNAYTAFHRLVYNIKRILPGGRITSYAAALYLLKEKYGISENELEGAMAKLGVDIDDILAEHSTWFILEDKKLAPGMYSIRSEKITSETCEPIVFPGDKVRINPNAFPVGSMFGIDVYEAVHINTGQTIHLVASELTK